MREKTFIMTTVILACFFIASAAFCKEQINWLEYEEGIEAAKAEKKKIYLNFFADWCGYCKIMDKQTFTNKEVIGFLNENFVSVKINSDKNKKVAREYKVKGLPTSWFLSDLGEKIHFQPGFIQPPQMLSLLKSVRDIGKKSSENVNWRSYDEGMEIAKSENKKIFLTFTSKTDPFSEVMENNTFKDPRIVEYLNKNYVPVKVDFNSDQKLASDFRVAQTPHMWFVKNDGERIGKQKGFVQTENLLLILKYIHSDSYKRMNLKDFYKTL